MELQKTAYNAAKFARYIRQKIIISRLIKLIEYLKALLFGIIEGITEWLPVSSTGHLIILNEIVSLKVSDDFYEMFQVVIQMGAILAVLVLFFTKLNPFSPSKSSGEKKDTWSLWLKVIVAVIPSAVLGVLFDDWFDEHFYNHIVVAIALIVYGVFFLFMEKGGGSRHSEYKTVNDIDMKTSVGIGVFQCLALIPGTSRSGSTILGAMLMGTTRTAAAEFSFFLAIPTMAGASLLKAVKFVLKGAAMSMDYWIILAIGCIVSFIVSLITIRALMNYVKNHTFKVFGVYRIILGAAVIASYFLLK